MNITKNLEKFCFRIGSSIVTIAKTNYAPISKYPPQSKYKGGNLKQDI
ncbi:hypothetical protein [Campylobacter fetus]|nr:hypothetical protein [Campylobacter fetus]QQF51481.1 hypothetical protein HHI31_01045 [Campylobacter fetus subsp. venerealis]